MILRTPVIYQLLLLNEIECQNHVATVTLGFETHVPGSILTKTCGSLERASRIKGFQ